MEKLSTIEMAGIGLAAVLIYLNYRGTAMPGAPVQPVAVVPAIPGQTDAQLALAVITSDPTISDKAQAAYDVLQTYRTGNSVMDSAANWNHYRQLWGVAHGDPNVVLMKNPAAHPPGDVQMSVYDYWGGLRLEGVA